MIVVTWRWNNPLTGLWGLWIAGRWRRYTCKHVLVGNDDVRMWASFKYKTMAMIMKMTMKMTMRMKIRVMPMSLTSSASSPRGETQEPFPLLSPCAGSMLETDLMTSDHYICCQFTPSSSYRITSSSLSSLDHCCHH